jgi:hypothetical protein
MTDLLYRRLYKNDKVIEILQTAVNDLPSIIRFIEKRYNLNHENAYRLLKRGIEYDLSAINKSELNLILESDRYLQDLKAENSFLKQIHAKELQSCNQKLEENEKELRRLLRKEAGLQKELITNKKVESSCVDEIRNVLKTMKKPNTTQSSPPSKDEGNNNKNDEDNSSNDARKRPNKRRAETNSPPSKRRSEKTVRFDIDESNNIQNDDDDDDDGDIEDASNQTNNSNTSSRTNASNRSTTSSSSQSSANNETLQKEYDKLKNENEMLRKARNKIIEDQNQANKLMLKEQKDLQAKYEKERNRLMTNNEQEKQKLRNDFERKLEEATNKILENKRQELQSELDTQRTLLENEYQAKQRQIELLLVDKRKELEVASNLLKASDDPTERETILKNNIVELENKLREVRTECRQCTQNYNMLEKSKDDTYNKQLKNLLNVVNVETAIDNNESTDSILEKLRLILTASRESKDLINNLQKTIEEYKVNVESLKVKNTQLITELNNIRDNHKRQIEDIQAKHTHFVGTLNIQINECKDDVLRQKASIERLNAILNVKNREWNISDGDNKYMSIRKSADESYNAIANTIQELNNRLKTLSDENKKLRNLVNDFNLVKSSLENNKVTNDEKINQLQQQLIAHENEEQNLNARINELSETNRILQTTNTFLNAKNATGEVAQTETEQLQKITQSTTINLTNLIKAQRVVLEKYITYYMNIKRYEKLITNTADQNDIKEYQNKILEYETAIDGLTLEIETRELIANLVEYTLQIENKIKVMNRMNVNSDEFEEKYNQLESELRENTKIIEDYISIFVRLGIDPNNAYDVTNDGDNDGADGGGSSRKLDLIQLNDNLRELTKSLENELDSQQKLYKQDIGRIRQISLDFTRYQQKINRQLSEFIASNPNINFNLEEYMLVRDKINKDIESTRGFCNRLIKYFSDSETSYNAKIESLTSLNKVLEDKLKATELDLNYYQNRYGIDDQAQKDLLDKFEYSNEIISEWVKRRNRVMQSREDWLSNYHSFLEAMQKLRNKYDILTTSLRTEIQFRKQKYETELQLRRALRVYMLIDADKLQPKLIFKEILMKFLYPDSKMEIYEAWSQRLHKDNLLAITDDDANFGAIYDNTLKKEIQDMDKNLQSLLLFRNRPFGNAEFEQLYNDINNDGQNIRRAINAVEKDLISVQSASELLDPEEEEEQQQQQPTQLDPQSIQLYPATENEYEVIAEEEIVKEPTNMVDSRKRKNIDNDTDYDGYEVVTEEKKKTKNTIDETIEQVILDTTITTTTTTPKAIKPPTLGKRKRKKPISREIISSSSSSSSSGSEDDEENITNKDNRRFSNIPKISKLENQTTINEMPQQFIQTQNETPQDRLLASLQDDDANLEPIYENAPKRFQNNIPALNENDYDIPIQGIDDSFDDSF